MQQYEDNLYMQPVEDVEKEVSRLQANVKALGEWSEKIRLHPDKAVLEMKERQLADVLNKYGQVDMSGKTSEQIALVFARLQGEEYQIRSDIEAFKAVSGKAKDSEKRLVIAKRVLAEKNKTGGRA